MPAHFDYIIIGSGFGGSVAALRLSEKGYRVAVIEQGRLYRPHDFPRTNWNLRKFLWMPRLGLYGIQAMTLLKDVFIFHGTGVGGGSLVYAGNLLIPPDEVFEDPAWQGGNWREKLAPHYETARRMLGVTSHEVISPSDELLRECATDVGRGDTFHVNDVGIYFGEEGVTVPDPFFDGEGPDRTGCTLCGGCMVGCRYGSKNSLDLNYLHLAERLGAEIIPETRVVDVRPSSGNNGYDVIARRVTGFLSPRREYHAEGVIFSGGTLGTVKLLHRCKARDSLPRLSNRLGSKVRTNSEAFVGIQARGKAVDYSQGLAIASGVYPDDDTHIETVHYAKGQTVMYLLGTVLTGGGKPWPRPLRFLSNVLLHPLQFLGGFWPFGRAERSIILLVMQKISNWLRLEYKRRWWRLGNRSMNSNWHTRQPVPSYIPIANDFARRMAAKVKGGRSYSILPEVVFDTSSTAHILGGCIMAKTPENGVTDFAGKIHGYDNLYVVDSSIVAANLGVNPSLTITALAEYIMAQFPEKRV
ncbi:MAG: GMC family oxidoreductase [Fidelibacterota bacterium]|nr:MAG: GMC family oxidoreductase [Candidatus Neomarinimicrobiota bacterium]